MKANIAHAHRHHQRLGATNNKLSAQRRTILTKLTIQYSDCGYDPFPQRRETFEVNRPRPRERLERQRAGANSFNNK